VVVSSYPSLISCFAVFWGCMVLDQHVFHVGSRIGFIICVFEFFSEVVFWVLKVAQQISFGSLLVMILAATG